MVFRNMLKWTCILVSVLFPGWVFNGSCAVQVERPNIIVILADDLGYGDLSSYGATDLQSPNIDRLAREGMRFTRFYANCPVCSPTRASLLTGRYPALVGVPGVIRTHANDSWGYLAPNAVLLTEPLRKHGYKTAIVGKWHLGLESPNTPGERGFDEFHGFLGDMMDDYYNHRRHGINYMRHNGREIDPDGHATDLFTQWACEYVERAAGEKETPFFLYLAYNAPHTPIQPPADWLEKVKAREPGIPDRRAKLVALIEHMDDGIGQVLKTLDLTGLSDRTLVVFASDNGGQVGVGANNGPTRAGKGTVYEGGIRVPAIVRWPGMVHPGTVSDLDLMTMDIAPTVLAAAGTEFCHPIDGLSFLPLLLGDDDSVPERVLYWRRREGGPFKGGDIDAVRKGAWKLLRPMPEEPLEMYYLENDPLEERNIIDEFGAVRDELTELLNRQIARYEQVHWQPPASANPE